VLPHTLGGPGPVGQGIISLGAFQVAILSWEDQRAGGARGPGGPGVHSTQGPNASFFSGWARVSRLTLLLGPPVPFASPFYNIY
jgi:hypothetical protein